MDTVAYAVLMMEMPGRDDIDQNRSDGICD